MPLTSILVSILIMKLTERELIRAKGVLLEIINRPIKETDNG